MDHLDTTRLVFDLLIMLSAGFVAALICRRLHVSMLIGYIVVGALIGGGVLKLVPAKTHEIEQLTEIGVLFLLFTIGLEFSFDDIRRTARQLFVGGPIQMLAVALPTVPLMVALGWPWNRAVVLGLALAMSSTVLVFKALADSDQSKTPAGRRAINILLFQDMAIVPLLLVIPLLTGSEEARSGPWTYLLPVLTTVGLFGGVLVLRVAIGVYVAPYLAMQRSRELVMLFSLILLAVVCIATQYLGLPGPLGALAAGLALGGNRLTHQIDALMLSFRETFAALFFVGLGLLFEPKVLIEGPLFMLAAFVVILTIKMMAGMLSARSTGLSWQASAGVGLVLTQVGEFAFVIAFTATEAGLIKTENYQRILILALASLMITPRLIKIGMQWAAAAPDIERPAAGTLLADTGPEGTAIVIGIGPVGRNVAHRLKRHFAQVSAVDLSPVNLHELAQDGVTTIVGDATRHDVLGKAGIARASHIFVCVPSDVVAQQVVTTCRKLNAQCDILVRCRFVANVSTLKRAGAKVVISEESQATQALMKELDKLNEV